MRAKLATKVKHQLSAPVYLESDLIRIKKYQTSLIDELLYNNPYNNNNGGHLSGQWQSRLIDEIRAVESWLKKHYELFMHNNNRKFELE